MKIGGTIQSADWKAEKHVPVIMCPDEVKGGQPFTVEVSVGKEISHPNTQELFIKWIDVYFQPEGITLVYQVGHFEFVAHGESRASVYTHPDATFSMQVTGPGTLMALSLCNIHGLWESAKAIEISN